MQSALNAALELVHEGHLTTAQVVEAVNIPLLATMRPEPRLARALDNGQFPKPSRGPLARAARTVLAALNTS